MAAPSLVVSAARQVRYTSKDPDCDGSDEAAPGNNSGGGFGIKGAPEVVNNALQNSVTAMLFCGNTTGRTTATRDGCSMPDD
jgi:hypothetical protein